MNINFQELCINNFFLKENYKVVFRMGESEDAHKRVEEVANKFQYISEYVFKNNKVWLLLFVWEEEDIKKLQKDKLIQCANTIYKIHHSDNILSYLPYDTEALYEASIFVLEYNEFEYRVFENLIKQHIGYELALDDTLNINFYLVSISPKYNALLNLYDDRGLELLTNNNMFLKDIEENKFPYSNSIIER